MPRLMLTQPSLNLHVYPDMTWINLCICAVFAGSSLCTLCMTGYQEHRYIVILSSTGEDFYQTAQTRRMIFVFACRV